MLYGRAKILCDETKITRENVVQVLQEAFLIHKNNSYDINLLFNEYKGNQDVLRREKEIRPEICNKIVENHANEIITFKAGYLCGEPLQYVSRGDKEAVTDEIGKLNDIMVLCSKDAQDLQLVEWMYIAGQGYRMGFPNRQYIETQVAPALERGEIIANNDESPFDIYTLDPRYTFVVYNSGLGEKPLMAVKYVNRVDGTIVFSIYTQNEYFEIQSTNLEANQGTSKEATQFDVVTNGPLTLGTIPIIEYPLNSARLGIFEIVRSILNAINNIQSNRVDGIEQFIQSLIVLYNCDIDDAAAKILREAGLIKLKSVGDNKADIKEIAEQLDQTQTQTLIDYMYQTVLNIVGMPNRNGGSSTSDTGSAVIMRDGWEAAEARAKHDEIVFKQAERQFLKIILRILRAVGAINLNLSDIDIKFTRRNYSELQSKVQALDMMLKNSKIAPIIAYTHCGMFSDPEDACKQGMTYYEEQQQTVATESSNTDVQPLSEGDALA